MDGHYRAWWAQGCKKDAKGHIWGSYWEADGRLLGSFGCLLEPFGGVFFVNVFPGTFLGAYLAPKLSIWGWIMCDFYVTVVKISMLAKSASGRLFGDFGEAFGRYFEALGAHLGCLG